MSRNSAYKNGCKARDKNKDADINPYNNDSQHEERTQWFRGYYDTDELITGNPRKRLSNADLDQLVLSSNKIFQNYKPGDKISWTRIV